MPASPRTPPSPGLVGPNGHPEIWIQVKHEEHDPFENSFATFEDWSLPPQPRGVPPREVRGGGGPGSMPRPYSKRAGRKPSLSPPREEQYRDGRRRSSPDYSMDRNLQRRNSNSLERRPTSRGGGRRTPTRSMGLRRRNSSLDRIPMQRRGSSMERTRSPPPRDHSLDRSAPSLLGRDDSTIERLKQQADAMIDRVRHQEWSDINAQTRSKASDLSMLSRQVSSTSASGSRSASASRSRRASAHDGGKKTPVDMTNVELALKIIEESSGKKLPRVGSSKDRAKSPSPRAAAATMAPGQPPQRPSASPSTNASAYVKLMREADTAMANALTREERRALDISVSTPLDGSASGRRGGRRARSVGQRESAAASFRDSPLTKDARRARTPGTLDRYGELGDSSGRFNSSAPVLDRKSCSRPAAHRDAGSYHDRMRSKSPAQPKSPETPMLDNSNHSFNDSVRAMSRMSRASGGVSAISNVSDHIRPASPLQHHHARHQPQHHQQPMMHHHQPPHQPAPPQQYEAPMKNQQPAVSDDWRKYQVSDKRSAGRRRSSQQPDEHPQQAMPQPPPPSMEVQEQSGGSQTPDWKKYSVGEQRGAARRSSERKSKMFGRERSKGDNMLTEREKLRSVKQMPYTDQFGDFGMYTGQVNEDGRPDGKGSMKYENGVFYEGTWTDGCQDSKAAANYERIRGGFTSWSGKGKSGSKHGMVLPWNARKNDVHEISEKTNVRGMEWIDLNGESGRYTGEVNNDRLPHGRGMMKYSYGLIAEGEWVNGVLKEGPQDRMISAVSGGMSVGAGMSVGGGAMSVGPGMSVGGGLSIGPGLSVGPMSVGRGHPGMPVMMPGMAPMPMPMPMGFNPMMGAPSNAAQHAMISQQNAMMRNMYGGGGGGSVYGGPPTMAGPMPPPMMQMPPPVQMMHPGQPQPQGVPQVSDGKPPVSEIKIGK